MNIKSKNITKEFKSMKDEFTDKLTKLIDSSSKHEDSINMISKK